MARKLALFVVEDIEGVANPVFEERPGEWMVIWSLLRVWSHLVPSL